MMFIIVTYCGDVCLEGFTGDSHEIFGQVDANVSFFVFLLVDTVERLVISTAVGPDQMGKLVFGSPPVRPAV